LIFFKDDALKQSFTFYQSKDVDRLESFKVPNSIKASRANAVPNAAVRILFLFFYAQIIIILFYLFV
jgi:hypothetical protein